MNEELEKNTQNYPSLNNHPRKTQTEVSITDSRIDLSHIDNWKVRLSKRQNRFFNIAR